MGAVNLPSIAAMLLIAARGFCAPEAPVQQGDPVLSALQPEMTRNLEQLGLPGQPRPYWMAFGHTTTCSLEVAARLGEVVTDDFSEGHYLLARMRVGSTLLDNTNFVGYGWGAAGAARVTTGPEATPPVVRDGWLAADAAYKSAVATLAAKDAALKRERDDDRAPDFSSRPAVTHWEAPVVLGSGDRDRLRALTRDLSGEFRGVPALQRAEVRISARAHTVRFMDTDGFRHRVPQRMVRILVAAEAQAADGTPLRDVAAVLVPGVDDLPPVDRLHAMARDVAARISARVSASELTDPYLGPILFTAPAAAEFLRQTLVADLSGTPAPAVSEDYFKSAARGGQLTKFLGLRVAPEWMSVTDEPALGAYEGQPLAGGYRVDREGVPAQRVELIADGKLRGFLMSRAPSAKIGASNGHGRIVAGSMVRAAPGNVIVTARGGLTDAGLLDKLLALAKRDGLRFALVVRHLEEPAQEGGPRRITVGTGEEDASEAPSRWAISPALDVVKVDVATRRETPLRGVIFGPIGIAELRDIVAAGRAASVYSWIQSPESADYYQGFAEDALVSLAAPALLFPQIEARPTARKRIPLPHLPHPFFAAAP